MGSTHHSYKLIGAEISLYLRSCKSGHHTETNLPHRQVFIYDQKDAAHVCC